MTYQVQFPGLGLEFEISRTAFTVFGIEIYWYGILIGAGMFLAVAFAFSQCRRFGIDGDRMVDVIFIGLITAIIGGRLYYVLFIDTSYDTFWELINLRAGGIAIYGAIIGAFLGAVVACKWRKVPVLPMFDLTAMGFLIGQCIGRWGNFFNQEAFGSNTTLPWGMISNGTTDYLAWMQPTLAADSITVDPSLPVHPTFLYESIWCALGFLLLFLYRNRRKFNGEIFLMYIMWYGVGRFVIEGLRTDSLMLGESGMRVSQLLAALSFLGALCVWVIAKVKTAGHPLAVPAIPPRSAMVAVETPQGRRRVLVEWPAEEGNPSKTQLHQMALEKWDAEHPDTIADKTDTEDDTEAADEAEAAEKQDAEPEPAKTEAETDTAEEDTARETDDADSKDK